MSLFDASSSVELISYEVREHADMPAANGAALGRRHLRLPPPRTSTPCHRTYPGGAPTLPISNAKQQQERTWVEPNPKKDPRLRNGLRQCRRRHQPHPPRLRTHGSRVDRLRG